MFSRHLGCHDGIALVGYDVEKKEDDNPLVSRRKIVTVSLDRILNHCGSRKIHPQP